MPNKKTCSSYQCQRVDNKLEEALHVIESGVMGVNEVSTKMYRVPYRMLRRKNEKLPHNFPNVFTTENEQLLVKHLLFLQQESFSLSRQTIRSIAYHFAENLKLNHHFNRISKKADHDWLNTFLRRNKEIQVVNITKESMEMTEEYLAQMIDFKRSDIFGSSNGKQAFKMLSDIFRKYDLEDKPENYFIFNEINIKESKESFSIISCYNAVGDFLAPVVVFQGVRLEKELFNELPEGSEVFLNNKSNSVNSQLLCEWLRHIFIPEKPKIKRILIFEDHLSYLGSNEVFSLTENNEIVVLTSQAAISYFSKCLKSQYEKEREKWLKNNESEVVTRLQMCSFLRKAFFKVAVLDTVSVKFSEFGIWPLNESVSSNIFYEINDISKKINHDIQRKHNERLVYVEDNSLNRKEDGDTFMEVENDRTIIEIKKEPIADRESENNCSIFATEPIFESVFMKQEEMKRFCDEDKKAECLYNNKNLWNRTDQATQIKNLSIFKSERNKIKHKSTQTQYKLGPTNYKECFIPNCSNTSLSDIKKVFVKVQLNNIIYKKWAKKFGPESFQSPFIFCENHFDLPTNLSSLKSQDIIQSKLCSKLKTISVHNQYGEQTILSTVNTKLGSVLCLRPKTKLIIETDLSQQVKSEVYAVDGDKFVCDSQVQCDIKIEYKDIGLQMGNMKTAEQLLYCSIPNCKSTNFDVPKKNFFSAPEDDRVVAQWSQSFGIDIHDWVMSYMPTVHCCEDHFNELDKVDDWERYKQEGCKVTVNLDKRDAKLKSVNQTRKRKLS